MKNKRVPGKNCGKHSIHKTPKVTYTLYVSLSDLTVKVQPMVRVILNERESWLYTEDGRNKGQSNETWAGATGKTEMGKGEKR